MARDGALQLSDYPSDVIHLACRKCDRRGQYRKAALLKRYGDATLPSVKDEIARCPRQGSTSDACGSYYVELVPSR